MKYIHCKYIDTLEALFFFALFFFSGHAPCTNDVSIVLNVLNVVRSLKAPMGPIVLRRSTFCLALLAKHRLEHQRQHFRNNCA